MLPMLIHLWQMLIPRDDNASGIESPANHNVVDRGFCLDSRTMYFDICCIIAVLFSTNKKRAKPKVA